MEYQFSLGLWEHYLASLRVTLRLGPLLVVHLLFPVIGVVLLVYWWQAWLRSPWMFGVLAIYVLFTPLITFVSVVVRRGQSRGAFRAMNVKITDIGITQENPIATTQVSWDKLLDVRETTAFYYFYLTTRMAILLPKRVVKSSVEEETIHALIRVHVRTKAT